VPIFDKPKIRILGYRMEIYDLVVIGGGPAGIFAALRAKSINPIAKISILENGMSLLSKVKTSGGGRCNITNAIFDPKMLCVNYPRGQKELLSVVSRFQPRDMIDWLEDRGVGVKIDEQGRVFPKSDDSETIIECFLNEIEKSALEVSLGAKIEKIFKNGELFELILKGGEKIFSKKVLLATGGSVSGAFYAEMLGHKYESFIPSLFPFKIKSDNILKLSGISQKGVKVSLKNSPYTKVGDILITHEGFSGPVIINLSSIAAKYLYEKNYLAELSINWLGNISTEEVIKRLVDIKTTHPRKILPKFNPFNFPNNLWVYLLNPFNNVFRKNLGNFSNQILAEIAAKLTSDDYLIVSKSLNKEEFVSCGGIDLKEVNFKDMQSKICNGLYFAGEILNIDGFTGGYNLQNCWSTGFIAGSSLNIDCD
jgi:predicted Rossmann fold flavoprotein